MSSARNPYHIRDGIGQWRSTGYGIEPNQRAPSNATSINVNCGCTIELREGDAPIKAWSCEHGQHFVAASYYEQWVRDGRPLGIIR